MKKLEAKYGLSATLSLVVGCVIGAGIFFKVDDVLAATQGNMLAGLLGWIIVGFSVISGAIALSYYAQLLPTEGGLLKYGEFRFGRKFSFFVGWFYMTIYYPVLGAVLFTVGSEFLVNLLKEVIDFTATPLHYSLIGIIAMLILFFINVKKPKAGGLIQSVSTVLKVIPLLIIAAFGIILLVSGDITEQNTLSYAAKNISDDTSLLGLTIASFIPIAFAFDGWYVATQISGEVKNAKKNLPIALIAGTSIVMIIYIFYYLGIVFEMGGDQIALLGNSYISQYAQNMGGKLGSVLMQMAIVISIYGAGNAILLAGIRVPYQLVNSGNSENFFNVLKVDAKAKMPMNSAYFCLVLVIFYTVTYYLTNTTQYFIDLKFDLSSFPVTFVYVIMFCLFIGLFKLILNNTIKGNKFIKILITLIALLGATIVLYGGVTTSNGLLYIILSLVILSIGLFVFKKDK